jgi:hypothetical protein
MLHFDWCHALYDTTRKGLGKLCPPILHSSRPPVFDKVVIMLHLPFSRHRRNGDLVLGRLWRFPVSPFVRVTASARTAHLYSFLFRGQVRSCRPSPHSTSASLGQMRRGQRTNLHSRAARG